MREILLITRDENISKLFHIYANKFSDLKLSEVTDLGKSWSMISSIAFNFSKVVLDIYIPDQDSLDFTYTLKNLFPDIIIIGLTTNPQIQESQKNLFQKIYLLPLNNTFYQEILS